MAAAYQNHAPLVELLLARGAEVDAINALGQTALHLACKQARARARRETPLPPPPRP